jgi:antitoxin VapB
MSKEAAVFKSNRSQAVRIPKELAFPDDVKRVTIERTEDGGLLIRPKQGSARHWEDYFRNGPFVTDDFLADREQGVAEERESFD